ncbi:nuclear transport factor 2 family protein [Thermoleophilia bacterium SCSIO 60948]|nr:nuclear transport factor 2 family protein [Thermoleophilia bacterium SCSIO 60948]
MSASALAVIEPYNAAWNRHDIDAICSRHAETIVFENHTAAERAEGAEEVRAHIAAILARWPDLSFRPRSTYAGDDFAVCEWTATATAPDGRLLEWDGVDLFPLTGGLIARKDVYSTSSTPRVLKPGGG